MNQFKSLSDQQLIELWPKEHDLIFAEIYERYWDKLLAVAYNRLDNLFDAEECVQDVFCKFWALREKFVLTGNSLNNYFARAIKNQIFTILKQRYSLNLKNKALPIEEDVHHFTPEKRLIIEELHRQFEKAIQNLPPQCKIIYTMKREEGLSVEEIANKLNISTNTVKSHLKKANRDIRNNSDLLTTLVIFFAVLQNK